MARPSTHGHAAVDSPEYRAWRHANQRCHYARHPQFASYGGRGIRMCDEWRKDFTAFLRHVGPRPSKDHSLDRIDNDKGYEPGNVRWATRSEQARNRRKRETAA